MAGNQRITFSFEGDSSGLRQAVDSAIRDLEKYTRAVSSASKNSSLNGAMSSASTIVSDMQKRVSELSTAMNGIINSKAIDNFTDKFQQTADIVDNVTKRFEGLGNMALNGSEAELNSFSESLRNVDDLLSRMEERTSFSSDSVNAYAMNLSKLNGTLQTTANDLVTSVTKTHGFQAALSRIQNTAQTVGQRFRDMFKPFTQAATNFAQNDGNKVIQALRSMVAAAKNVASTNTDTAGRTASSWQKVSDTFGTVRQSVERLIYKIQNYDRIQREVYKNQQAHARSLEKQSNWEANGKKGRQPNQVDLMSEEQIIDQLMASGAGKGTSQAINTLMRKVAQFLRPLKQLTSTVFQSLSKAGSMLVSSLKSVGTALTTAGRGMVTFGTNTNVAVAGLRGFSAVAKSLPSILKTIASQILQISFSNFLAEATQQSIAFVENLNLFAVSMGTAANEAQDFIDRMSELYGMNPSNLYRYAGYFAQITGAIGLTDEAAMKLSTSMTKMSNDIASLYNVEIEQVTENLGSGLQGLNQAVRKYGIDMRQTTIQQTAFKYGLTQNVATMSESNRVVLRYLTMVEQMRNAIKQTTTDFDGANKVIGDFARNIETPANQLRIFSEQIQQLATTIGSFLIPVVQRLLPILNGVVMALRMILQFFAQLFGIDMLSWGGEVSAGSLDAADGIDSIGDAADSTSKKVKDLLAPFDELHILNEQLGSGSSGADLSDWGELDPALLKALEDLQLQLDDINMKAHEIRDTILAIFGLTPDLNLIPNGFIDKLIDFWKNGEWEKMGEEIAKFFNQAIDWALENITWDKFKDDIIAFLDAVTGIFNGFVKYFDWEGFGHVGANLVNIIFHTIEEAIDRVEWAILGYQLSQMFNGLFGYIEWDLIGRTYAKGMNAAFEILLGFVTGFNYKQFADGIVTGLNTAIAIVEPEIFGEALSRLIRGLITMLGTLVDGINISTLIDKMYAMLGRIINGVATQFEGSSGWYELGNAITRGLMRVFEGLNVAITKWGDLGITAALMDFLQGAIEGINTDELRVFIDNVLNGIINLFTKFRERFDAREMTREFVLWLGEVIQGIHISELVADITGFIQDFFGGIVDAFKIQKNQQGGNLIHIFFEMIEDIFKGFPWGDIGYVIGNFVGELISHIISFFTSAQFLPFVTGFISGIADAFQQHPEAWQTIKDLIAFYLVGIVTGIPPQLAGPFAVVATWISSTIRNFFTSLFEGIGEWIKGFLINIGGIVVESLGNLLAKFPGKLGEIGQQLRDYGTQLREDAHAMMDTAFDGVFTSMNTNGPEIVNKFSKSAQDMIDEADKKFATLPTIIEKHYSNVSEVSRTKLSQMQSYLSQKLDEIQTNLNGSLTAIVADVEGNWHQIEITNETTWNDIYTTIKTEMGQTAAEVDARTEEIKNTLVNKIQWALDHIEGLEWESTGINGVKKLKGGFETEWGNFEVYVDEATGQVVQLIENTLDSPSYSILANNLTSTFRGAFNQITSGAQSMLTNIENAFSRASQISNSISNLNKDATTLWNEMQNMHSQSQQLAQQTAANRNTVAANITTGTNTSTNVGNRNTTGTLINTNTTPAFQQTLVRDPITGVWSYPKMATGGVVTGPTNAIIGEAGRAEAVIPLDRSPQMKAFAEDVSDSVTRTLANLNVTGASQTQQQPIEVTVKVQIGEKDWDAFVYESAERGKRDVGASPVEVRS